jgi:hypothetical protein
LGLLQTLPLERTSAAAASVAPVLLPQHRCLQPHHNNSGVGGIVLFPTHTATPALASHKSFSRPTLQPRGKINTQRAEPRNKEDDDQGNKVRLNERNRQKQDEDEATEEGKEEEGTWPMSTTQLSDCGQES